MSTNVITSDLQGLEIDSGLVTLFELEYSSSTTLYFHPGLSTDIRVTGINGTTITINSAQTLASGVTLTFTGYTTAGAATSQQTTITSSISNSTTLAVASATNLKVGMVITGTGIIDTDYSPIVFDGNTYYALPLEVDGLDIKNDGAMNRPTLSIANIESIVRDTSLFQNADDGGTDGIANFKLEKLIGKKLTERTTLEKYLTIDPTVSSSRAIVEYPIRKYIIDRIKTKTPEIVMYELAAPHDLEGVMLPARVVIGKYCPWEYQGRSFSTPIGACTWPVNGGVPSRTGSYVYFTGNDEAIIWWGLLHDVGGAVKSGKTWNSSSSFLKSSLVALAADGDSSPSWDERSYTYWQARATNTNSEPAPNNSNWEQVFLYRAWLSGTTFKTHSTQSERNDYVIYPVTGASGSTVSGWSWTDTSTIYRCIIETNSAVPSNNSDYWVRGDLCGKLLTSCKKRFQSSYGNQTQTTTASNTLWDSNVPLPFGGFPGSRRHR